MNTSGMINWHVRYARLLAQEPALFDPDTTVLEVGCGPWGVALWLQRPITGVERDLAEARNPLIDLVHGDITELPFEDESFDMVICSDVLEHLRRDERRSALHELVRVARDRLLVTCPCGEAAVRGEAAFAGFLGSLGVGRPNWLDEHLLNGLPNLGHLLSSLHDEGVAFDVVGNESRLQHFGGLLLDVALPDAADWNIEHAGKSVLEPPVGPSRWDSYYSYLITVDKHRRVPKPKHPSLDAARPSARELTSALYAVVHDASLMDDIAPLRYVRSGAAAEAPAPALAPPSMVDAGHLANSRWSELSAIHTIWRDGPKTDVVGFCHYRRFFDFGESSGRGRETTIDRNKIPEVKPALDFTPLVPAVAEGLLIVARPVDLGEPVFDNYCRYHNTNDFLRLLGVVAELHPELLPFLLEDFDSPLLYCNNMFLANWGLFDCLCSSWFEILEDWCARSDRPHENTYQNRDVSFLSERVFSAWVKYARSRGLRVQERPIFFVADSALAPASVRDALALAREPAFPIDKPFRAATASLQAALSRTAELEDRLSEQSAELATTLAALKEQQAAIDAIARSASWRLTAPLRGATQVARRAMRASDDKKHRGAP